MPGFSITAISAPSIGGKTLTVNENGRAARHHKATAPMGSPL
jgi:hypothetical protein